MIDCEHTCEQCNHYQDNEPCTATGQLRDPWLYVGDCNLFEAINNEEADNGNTQI